MKSIAEDVIAAHCLYWRITKETYEHEAHLFKVRDWFMIPVYYVVYMAKTIYWNLTGVFDKNG